MLDFEPATSALARVVDGVRDDQLQNQTPCEGTRLGDMLDHVQGLALAFTAAATKTRLPGVNGPSKSDGSRLEEGWRERIRERLDKLAEAWRDESAWQGMTTAGGLDMPAESAAAVALDEIVVHGWDVARASGQSFSADPHVLEAALAFVRPTATSRPQGTPGLFGPPVAVPADAPLLDQLIGLTGRDPKWQPNA
jgi:uncharacterized protein (TIGR03086 family)